MVFQSTSRSSSGIASRSNSEYPMLADLKRFEIREVGENGTASDDDDDDVADAILAFCCPEEPK